MANQAGAMSPRSAIILAGVLLGLGATAVSACGSEKPTADTAPSASASGSSSADLPANLGGKLGKAVRAAPSAFASGVGPGVQPPPDGIFPEGDADKILPKGAAPQIQVFDEGTGNKVTLSSYALAGDWKQTVAVHQLQIVSNRGKGGLPPIGCVLAFHKLQAGEPEPKELPPEPAPSPSSSASAGPSSKPNAKPPSSAKPNGSAAASAGPAKPKSSAAPLASGSSSAAPATEPPPILPAPVEPATATGSRVVITITDAKVEADANQVPKQTSDLVEQLNGATIAYTQTAFGPIDFAETMPPAASDELHLFLSAVEQMLSAEYVVAPGKPMGLGGYYMVIDRGKSLLEPFGVDVDVLRYRVFRVVALKGDTATVQVAIQQYSTVGSVDAGGKSVKLDEFMGQGQAALEVGPQNYYPQGGFAQLVGQVAFGGGPQGQQAGIGLQLLGQLGKMPAGVQIQAPPGAGGGGGEDE